MPASDIETWLARCGLSRYGDVFRENEITVDLLPELTDEDLRELGLPMGPRKRFLRQIRDTDLSEASSGDTGDVDQGRSSQGADRRQLTVVFVDLADSTRLSRFLDVEDLREVTRRYQETVRSVVEEFGGFVARYMGDGVLAYFGYPAASEDDAERAVLAGLELSRVIPDSECEQDLAVRVGIATGEVVVGDLIGEGASREAAVVGQTPNLAARLQGVAELNQVVLSATTARLVQGLIRLEPLPPQDLKGFDRPQASWAAIRRSDAETRFDARKSHASGTMVGRHSELGLLEQRWSTALQGEGQVLLLQGEPGIGKSRLADEFCGLQDSQGYLVQRFQCTPYHTSSPLYPFASRLERVVGAPGSAPPEVRLGRLRGLVLSRGPEKERALALLAAMLSIEGGEEVLADLASTVQRRETVRALCGEFEAATASEPVLALFEDVHWIDPTSREVLLALVERVQRLPAMLVLTHRPGFEGFDGFGHVTKLQLNRLGRSDGVSLVRELAGGKELPEEVLGEILDKTDGVPLFVEEFSRSVLEAGLLDDAGDSVDPGETAPAIPIPSTLRDSLMARLDRLGGAREVAQAAACIGREFDFALLTEILDVAAPEMNEGLELLVAHGLVFGHGEPPDSTYTFKHALVQDAARDSLLRSRRVTLHARVAEALKGSFSAIGNEHPELIAQHLTEAGEGEEAVEFWIRAGRRSASRSAHLEAESQLKRALELIPEIRSTQERNERELEVHTTLAPVYMATKGYAAEQVAATYQRAGELCEASDDREGQFKVQLGLRFVAQIGGRTVRALELGQRCLAIAEELSNRAFQAQACAMISHTQMLLARFAEAQARADEAIDLYRTEQRESHLQLSGLDPGVFATTVSSWVRWLTGAVDEALRESDRAIALARELDHAQSLEHALSSSALTYLFHRQPGEVRRRAEEALSIATQRGFLMRVPMSQIPLAWCDGMEDSATGKADLVRAALDAYYATGARGFSTYYMAVLAEVLARGALHEQALEVVDEGVRLGEEMNEYWWKAELLRLRGELLAPGSAEAGEDALREAVDVARSQGARMWELRAASSLARLLGERGEPAQARAVLAPALEWFPESVQAEDVSVARELLVTLT